MQRALRNNWASINQRCFNNNFFSILRLLIGWSDNPVRSIDLTGRTNIVLICWWHYNKLTTTHNWQLLLLLCLLKIFIMALLTKRSFLASHGHCFVTTLLHRWSYRYLTWISITLLHWSYVALLLFILIYWFYSFARIFLFFLRDLARLQATVIDIWTHVNFNKLSYLK